MDLEYLKNELLPQREKEIEEGKNGGTRNPIYVVMEEVENYIDGWVEEMFNVHNLKDRNPEYGYVDLELDSDDREFKTSSDDMKDPIKITKFYTDRYVAFFLTRKGAEDYLKYQKHNLRKPYIYTFGVGYRNDEMEKLFKK